MFTNYYGSIMKKFSALHSGWDSMMPILAVLAAEALR